MESRLFTLQGRMAQAKGLQEYRQLSSIKNMSKKSWLRRCSTAWGPDPWNNYWGGPAGGFLNNVMIKDMIL